MIKLSEIKTDCRYFKGHIPCSPNKKYGVVCNSCDYYDKTDGRILIIKLGAAGDVIRTTPLLFPISQQYPNAKIYWLTYFPDLVPKKNRPCADRVFIYNLQNVNYLSELDYELVINLDKDHEAISIMSKINSKRKEGFTMKDGHCYPVNENAVGKFITGLFDSVSISNKKSYMEEIFEICGYKFKGERYILDLNKDADLFTNGKYNISKDKDKLNIGLNTGCGARWISRLWKNEYWEKLINLLMNKGYRVILLGGSQEDENNKNLSKITGADYFGYFELESFITLMDKCDIIVTQVTMGMHIAIALNKKLVLMNNIFNPNEFELYGNGIIASPDKECKCYFQPECTNKEYQCMDHLTPEKIFSECERLADELKINESVK